MSGSSEPGLRGKWREKYGITYKNKRDFGGGVRWLLIYNDTKVLNIYKAHEVTGTKQNIYDCKSRKKCLDKAMELGLEIPDKFL